MPIELRNDQAPCTLTLPIWEPVKSGTAARLRLVLFQHIESDEVTVQLNGTTLKPDLVDAQWKDPRIFSPDPQPSTVTPGALVRNLAAQKLTRMEFLVPTEILKRGENSIAISVNRKSSFPPSKSVKIEKVELHLKGTTMKHTLAVLTALLLVPLAALHAADNPFASAKAVWRMTTEEAAGKQPFALKENGSVKFVQLGAADAAESRKRGGADTAATLTAESFLSLETEKATQLRPTDDALTLYARARFDPGAAGTLFFSDFLTLGVHPSGLAIALLGVKTPQGKVYREMPLAVVESGGWLDLVLRVGGGRVEFFCDGQLKCTIPLRQSLAVPFTNELRLGAMHWLPAKGGMGHPKCESGTKHIATVALWHRPLADGEIAFLSGVSEVKAKQVASAFDQAILDYNAFFDASLAKDVGACGKLSRSLQAFAAQDLQRPIYHLSQPLGWIFDPAALVPRGPLSRLLLPQHLCPARL